LLVGLQVTSNQIENCLLLDIVRITSLHFLQLFLQHLNSVFVDFKLKAAASDYLLRHGLKLFELVKELSVALSLGVLRDLSQCVVEPDIFHACHEPLLINISMGLG